MAAQALNLLKSVFVQCLSWTETLFSSVGGVGIVLSAIAVVLLAGIFILPIRGGSGGFGMDAAFTDFKKNVISVSHKGKYENGKVAKPVAGYRGKWESRQKGGHRASPR